MQPIVKTFTGATPEVADSVATVQSLPGSGNITIDGSLAVDGVAYISPAQKVSCTSAFDDSALLITITGKNQYGDYQQEVITGPSIETVYSTSYFSEVSEIQLDGATDGISFGNSGETVSQIISLENYARAQTCYQVSLDEGSNMTWSLFGTLDNPNDPVHPCPVSEMQFLASSEGGLVGQSSTQWSQCSWTPLYVRLGILGTGSGRITIVQFGSVPQ